MCWAQGRGLAGQGMVQASPPPQHRRISRGHVFPDPKVCGLQKGFSPPPRLKLSGRSQGRTSGRGMGGGIGFINTGGGFKETQCSQR